MSIEDNITKLQNISLERERGPLSQKSTTDFHFLVQKVLQEGISKEELGWGAKNIKTQNVNSNDIEKVKVAFLKIQLSEIIQNEFSHLDSKDPIFKLLFPTLQLIPSKEEKIKALRVLIPYFEQFSPKQSKICLELLQLLPPDQLDDRLLLHVCQSLHQRKKPDFLFSLYRLFSNFPSLQETICERFFKSQALSKIASKLLQNDPLLKQIKTIEECLRFFPEKHHTSILPLIIKNLAALPYQSTELILQDVLCTLPELKEEVNEVIQHKLDETQDVSFAFKLITMALTIGLPVDCSSFKEASRIYSVLEDFPKAFHELVFCVVKPILQTYPDLDYGELMQKTFETTPPLRDIFLAECEKRLGKHTSPNKAFEFCSKILQNTDSLGIEYNHPLLRKAYIFSLFLEAIPDELKQFALEEANDLIANKNSFEGLFLTIYIRRMDRPDLQKLIRTHITNLISKGNLHAAFIALLHPGIFQKALPQAHMICRLAEDHLTQRLQDENPITARKAAFNVLLRAPRFFYRLVDLSLHINEITKPEKFLESNNPYGLFKRLKELELASPIDMSLSFQTVADQSVSLKLPEMAHFTFSNPDFDQLPSITFQDLSNLFKNLYNRLDSLPQEEQMRIQNYIHSITEEPLKTLTDNFIGSSYIYKLLESKNPIDRLEKAYFVSILHYITDQDPTVKEGELLSAREEALLKMSASIQHCPAGKTSGIFLAYSHLSEKYTLGQIEKTIDPPQVAQTKQFVKTILTNEITHLLSDDGPFMRELLIGLPQEHAIPQLSHQSLYIRNLIGKDLGLNYPVAFDLHSHLIHPALLAKSRKETLEVFYKHFNPKTLVDNLVNSFTRMTDKEKGPLFQAIDSLKLGSKEEMWDIEDGLRLTENGAVNILLYFGLLQQKK